MARLAISNEKKSSNVIWRFEEIYEMQVAASIG